MLAVQNMNGQDIQTPVFEAGFKAGLSSESFRINYTEITGSPSYGTGLFASYLPTVNEHLRFSVSYMPYFVTYQETLKSFTQELLIYPEYRWNTGQLELSVGCGFLYKFFNKKSSLQMPNDHWGIHAGGGARFYYRKRHFAGVEYQYKYLFEVGATDQQNAIHAINLLINF